MDCKAGMNLRLESVPKFHININVSHMTLI